MLLILFGAAFCSFLVAIALIRYQHIHAHLSADHDVHSIQKFHQEPVPRIGGVAIMAGLLVGFSLLYLKYHDIVAGLLLLSSLPAFLAGLAEDITKQLGVRLRLIATFASAGLGYWLLGAGLDRVDLPGMDLLLSHYWPISLLVTVIAVGGVAHAVNIIDGYNGLSGMVAMLIFLALAYVSFKVGDQVLLGISLACCGGVLGFFVWNFPHGMIFAGDGGAYLIGFLIAEISTLLIVRHPQVSAWFPLLLVIYPVFETLFSIYRKKVLRGMSPGIPDGLHLHMLIYKRLVRWMTGNRKIEHHVRLNSLTSPYLWLLTVLSVIPAMLFWNHTPLLMICVVLFAIIYLRFYRMLILFKSPSWIKLYRVRGHTDKPP